MRAIHFNVKMWCENVLATSSSPTSLREPPPLFHHCHHSAPQPQRRGDDCDCKCHTRKHLILFICDRQLFIQISFDSNFLLAHCALVARLRRDDAYTNHTNENHIFRMRCSLLLLLLRSVPFSFTFFFSFSSRSFRAHFFWIASNSVFSWSCSR